MQAGKSPQSKGKKRTVNKSLCKVCNIWVACNSVEEHEKGKKHISLGNQVLWKARVDKKIASEGIFISGNVTQLSNETIINYFSKFGEILAFQRPINDTRGLLQFKYRFHAKVLKIPHMINGFSLHIQPRELIQKDTQVAKKFVDHIETFKTTFEKMLESSPKTTIDEQFQVLTKLLEMKDETKTQRSRIVSTLEEWLSLEFPGCSLHVFGSSVSGLAFCNESDIDIYFETQLIKDSSFGGTDRSSTSSRSPDKLKSDQKQEECQVLRRVSNVLRTHPDVSKLVVISGARIPVSKFLHTPSGINFDLTCGNKIGVQNSKLLFGLQRFDDRIKPFFYTLKFWAKCHRLVSSPESTLSSYALMLLAIFFLQQTDPPLLPSIESLQTQVPKGKRIYSNGWNVSFQLPTNYKAKAEPLISSKVETISLLNGFWGFYGKMNPQEMVICPLKGKILTTEEFNEVFQAEIEKSSMECGNIQKTPFKPSTLSVQDPFELNFNVTLHFRNFELFQSLCLSAEQTCSKILAAQSDDVSLISLFKQKPQIRSLSQTQEPIPHSFLTLEFHSKAVHTLAERKEICQLVNQFLCNLFVFSYGIRITKFNRGKKKRQKTDNLEESKSIDANFQWGANYDLSFPFNMFQEKRNQFLSGASSDESDKSLLDCERAITSLLSFKHDGLESKEGIEASPSDPFALLHFSLNCNASVPSLTLKFKNSAETPNSIFMELVNGIEKCIGKVVEKYFTEKNLSHHQVSVSKDK